MLSKIGDLIDKSLNTRVAPIAYLFAVLGLIRGFAYTVFPDSQGVRNTLTSQVGAVIPLDVWGMIVLTSSVVLLVGMYIKNAPLTMGGALGMCLTWGCTMVSYASAGFWTYLVPISVVNILIYGYLFITAPIGRLWDYTPSKG